MSEDRIRTKVTSPTTSGLHNDFSEQEATMTNSAMPPKFALTASGADENRGTSTDTKPPGLHVDGIPQELVDLLVKHEGVVYSSYPDNGHVSAGLGHLLKTKEEQDRYPVGTPVSKEQVEAWAQQDVGEAWRAAQSQATMLGVESHDFKVALASMSFQNGVYWYTEHRKTWTLMKEHKWAEAATEAADSEWAVQTPARLADFQAALQKLEGNGASSKHDSRGWGSNHVAGQGSTPSMKSATTSSTTAPPTTPQGVEGVRQVQTRLKALGLYDGAIDGKELRGDGKESGTTKGIKEFQRLNGLPVTGKMDAVTWAKLDKGESLSLWHRFMASLKERTSERSKKGKGGGLADPFRKMAAEAKRKAAGEECGGTFSETGNFMDKSHFISQNSREGANPYASKANSGGAACRKVATEMLIHYLAAEKPETMEELGVSGIGDMSVAGNFLRILDEDKSHKSEVKGAKNESHPEWLVSDDQAEMAIAYIDGYLQRRVPVLVGVDHTYNRDIGTKKASKTGNGYNEGTTDHYVTLSGIGKDEQGRKYYSFFDPGRDNPSGGSGTEVHNRLIHEGGTRFKAANTGSSSSQTYHLTMVVVFPADRESYAMELNKNASSWIR